MPELMVSSTAAVEGHSDLSIGNIVGSNIANLFLILGICSIIKPLRFQKATEKFENFVTIFATAILLFFGNNTKTNVITRLDGIILLGCAVTFILYNIYRAKQKSKNLINIEDERKYKSNVIKSILKIILGVLS